ncbi:MAG: lysine biosynthesis protein LysX [Nitrosopumilus sp.]|nr:lysine biosynthesis protein LysX [Nitrosopumilus sp.]CAI9830885.1 Alpha-aminoadipate--LysW ligase LysX [Nitrosopumilaceae archaeon]MDA7942707.1 lysine biosynthesis protein LysX [Nitrosopumilus sp.]MDA7945307.1 lysine biosynthesis protein LysX [Nitrosopumilus sp.]MDA7952779.1 lysine biosynthesis protein LysX [Nitrosopumilus sp.]
MPRLCIAFDRLRAEEKMLRDSAEGAGYAPLMVDAKTVRAGTSSGAAPFGDAVLERCVSYFRGLHLSAHIEMLGIPVVNTLAVASACGDKLLMTARLKAAGVPTPETHFAFSAEAAAECAEREGYPLVIKPLVGSWGRGVVPIRDRDALDAIIEIRSVRDGPHDRIYYLQELVDRPPRDIRVVTVGGEPVAAMYRRSGGFKTNLALDGTQEPCRITPEMAELASRASEAVGGGILGVDMMEDRSRGLLVHEVNNTVEFKGISRVTEADIPGAMVGYAAGLVRK